MSLCEAFHEEAYLENDDMSNDVKKFNESESLPLT